MKKTLLLAGGLVSTLGFAAQPVFQPIGSSFTTGGSPNQRALSTSTNNPAASFLMVNSEEDDHFRFGILGPGGFGYELGQVDSLEDKINDLTDELDKKDLSISDINVVKDKANSIVSQLGKDATFKMMMAGQIPLMPFIYKHSKYGAFTFDMSLSAEGKGSVLDDDVTPLVNPLTQTFQLQTTTSIYVKNAVDLNFGLGYSRDIWTNHMGMLVGGAKVNVHSITLGKSLVSLSGATDDKAGDVFTDALKDNQKTTVGAGLDLGLIWTANNYQIGATLTNVNEPKFDYASLADDCASKTGAAQDNCYAARNFAGKGRIKLNESHVMERQLTLDSAVSLSNRQWTLAGSVDLFETHDPVGDLYQWGTVSASYYGDSNWIPGARIGYRKNMTGSELSYVTGGLTLFKRLNLDLAYGLESIDAGGTAVPRSLFFSAGIESAF